MTANTGRLPYSPAGLERLAVALGVDSALIWVSPTKGRLEIRDIAQHQETATDQPALDEDPD